MVASINPSAHPLTASGEHLAAAFARLAAKGAAEGVTVEYAHTGSIGTYTASSASAPGVRYCIVIDPRSPSYGCDCQGWERHQRCKHFALALEAAGWLPEPPEPEGGAPAPRIRIPIEPANIDAAIQRIRDNRELARIAAEAVAERRSLGLIREDFPVYAAGPRRPQPGDCPRCAGMAWNNCSACCGSGICPTCLGSGLWHTGDDAEHVVGPDGAAWICPDCAMFRRPDPAAPSAVPVVGRVAEEESVYLVGPIPPDSARQRPDGCLGPSNLGRAKMYAAHLRAGGYPAARREQALADQWEAEWLAALRRRLADDRSN
jgi:hypothetical protein